MPAQVSDGRRHASRGSRRQPARTAFELDESKLLIPPARPGIVPRTALVQQLLAPPTVPVLTVTAPAGYGKTSLLAQWAQRRRPRVAWVSADDRDNDPAVLLTFLAHALDRVERIEPKVFRSLASPGAGIADVLRLVSSITSMQAPVYIVLDSAEVLTNRECLDMVAELALRLPSDSQLAVGCRQAMLAPVPRLRAQGTVVEISSGDLAMDEDEARLLLAGADLKLTDDDLRSLVNRTEGWPAGLYLAALAMNAGGHHEDVGGTFTGDDRYMADYLRSEFLSRVSRTEESFLTRTSILDRLSGPLCDATVGGKGSARALDRLERRNLLVIPLDRRGDWYRYHRLFRELLYAELTRSDPDMVAVLHTRAAAWCETNGLVEEAIEHAQRAGDADRVERLVLDIANPVWAGGRLDTVLRWMEWFSDNNLVEKHPAVAVHGALIYALIGKAGEADRWAAAAERTEPAGMLSDGNTMEGSLAYLRVLLCRDGLDEMRRDAQVAMKGLSYTSPYRAAMLHAEGIAALYDDGDLDEADAYFARAADEATTANMTPFIPILLAERGLVAIERDDWAQAEALAAQAMTIMDRRQFDEYWTSAFVYAWAARVAAHEGDVTRASEVVVRAARLRPLLTYALPVVSVQALLELARAYIALADPGGALAALRQIADIQQFRRKLGALADQADELRSRLEQLKGEMLGASTLTAAELRVLPLLATHLSLAEISERLFVSRNTVKTQAISIYRKLGVSTRSETIKRMHQVGLVAFT